MKLNLRNCYKEKGDALRCGSFRRLKMFDRVLKIVEHVLKNIIKDQICIEPVNFEFMKGKSGD